MSKYLLFNFFFSLHAFFLDLAGRNFFSFSTRLLFLFLFFLPFYFLLLELSCFSSFFLLFFWGLVSTVVFLLFSFLLSRGAAFFFLFSVLSFFLVSFFWGPCVFSLPLYRLNKPLEIYTHVLSLIVSLITQSYHTHDTDMPSSGSKYIYVPYPYTDMRNGHIMFIYL